MRLSTCSRGGTRLTVDMAQHCNQGFIRWGDVASRQKLSGKYLEQVIIPLQKAHDNQSRWGTEGWKEAAAARFDGLPTITRADLAAKASAANGREMNNVL